MRGAPLSPRSETSKALVEYTASLTTSKDDPTTKKRSGSINGNQVDLPPSFIPHSLTPPIETSQNSPVTNPPTETKGHTRRRSNSTNSPPVSFDTVEGTTSHTETNHAETNNNGKSDGHPLPIKEGSSENVLDARNRPGAIGLRGSVSAPLNHGARESHSKERKERLRTSSRPAKPIALVSGILLILVSCCWF